MRCFSLRKKTGFRVLRPDSPLLITDTRGKEFYSNSHLEKPIKSFNLPAGIDLCLVKGEIIEMKEPKKYRLPLLPKRERFVKPLPKNFKIVFLKNPNKCTIYWRMKTILFDDSFYSKPLPYVMYILFHEYGHHRYKTEKYADIYAARTMLIRGYNPSQIALAQINSLSNRNFERKKFIVKNLKKA